MRHDATSRFAGWWQPDDARPSSRLPLALNIAGLGGPRLGSITPIRRARRITFGYGNRYRNSTGCLGAT
jgi:hypothetical protein